MPTAASPARSSRRRAPVTSRSPASPNEPPFERLTTGGWSVMNLGLHASALLGRGSRATAAVGKAIFALERGKATKLADAPAPVIALAASANGHRRRDRTRARAVAGCEVGSRSRRRRTTSRCCSTHAGRSSSTASSSSRPASSSRGRSAFTCRPRRSSRTRSRRDSVLAASARELVTIKSGVATREALPALAIADRRDRRRSRRPRRDRDARRPARTARRTARGPTTEVRDEPPADARRATAGGVRNKVTDDDGGAKPERHLASHLFNLAVLAAGTIGLAVMMDRLGWANAKQRARRSRRLVRRDHRARPRRARARCRRDPPVHATRGAHGVVLARARGAGERPRDQHLRARRRRRRGHEGLDAGRPRAARSRAVVDRAVQPRDVLHLGRDRAGRRADHRGRRRPAARARGRRVDRARACWCRS